jgi:hypothetical protein
MFRHYRSKAFQWHAPELRAPVNVPECLDMEKAVSLLPEKHRDAIRWNYVRCDSPLKMARYLGVSTQGLLELVGQGRTMLKNRGEMSARIRAAKPLFTKEQREAASKAWGEAGRPTQFAGPNGPSDER